MSTSTSHNDKVQSRKREFADEVHHLKEILGNTNLTLNQCLATTVSTLELHDHFAGRALLDQAWDSIDVTAFLGNGGFTNDGSKTLELTFILNCLGAAGLCFAMDGEILYESPNFIKHFGTLATCAGNNLKRIMHNNKKVLTKIFDFGITELLCQFKFEGSYCSKSSYRLLKGRVFELKSKGAVFLGYFKDLKPEAIDRGLTSPFQRRQVHIHLPSMTFIGGRPSWLTKLIGALPKSAEVGECAMPESMSNVPDKMIELSTGKTVYDMVFYLCKDGMILYLFAKLFMHPSNPVCMIAEVMPISKELNSTPIGKDYNLQRIKDQYLC